MRLWVLVLLAACGKDAKPPPAPTPARTDAGSAILADAAPSVKVDSYPDLATALKTIVPAGTRVVGFGEMHSRTDRVQVKSALSRFTTDGLPVLADQLSDLIVETWIVDPKCGQSAKTATAKVEITVRRPQETKSEIALLAEAARAAKVQPHAMRIECADYEKIAPSGKDVKPEELLSLTTRELGRIAEEALAYRSKHGDKRPLIALYGGSLHNDRFPTAGVEDWSYAAKVDALTHGAFVEIDLIVPELAAADPSSQTQPWFPLVTSAATTVQVFTRGERSFVVILPKS